MRPSHKRKNIIFKGENAQVPPAGDKTLLETIIHPPTNDGRGGRNDLGWVEFKRVEHGELPSRNSESVVD